MTGLFYSTLCVTVIFLYGCIGETITEKSGHLNLGTPGVMCMGALGGYVGCKVYTDIYGLDAILNNGAGSAFLGILLPVVFCFVLSGLAGLLYCFLVDTLKCNQNITGLVITTLGVAMLKYFGTTLCGIGADYSGYNVVQYGDAFKVVGRDYFQSYLPQALKEAIMANPNANWFAHIFLNHGFLFYLSFIVAIVVFIIIRFTRIGLSLRAVGENPGTSDASGINVNKYKYLATMIGSWICGLGGLYFYLEFSAGNPNYEQLDSYGWVAVALVIFSIWNTAISMGGSLLFAFLYSLPGSSLFNGVVGQWKLELIKAIPYVATIIVLVIISMLGKRETQPPSALGQSYYREDR